MRYEIVGPNEATDGDDEYLGYWSITATSQGVVILEEHFHEDLISDFNRTIGSLLPW